MWGNYLFYFAGWVCCAVDAGNRSCKILSVIVSFRARPRNIRTMRFSKTHTNTTVSNSKWFSILRWTCFIIISYYNNFVLVIPRAYDPISIIVLNKYYCTNEIISYYSCINNNALTHVSFRFVDESFLCAHTTCMRVMFDCQCSAVQCARVHYLRKCVYWLLVRQVQVLDFELRVSLYDRHFELQIIVDWLTRAVLFPILRTEFSPRLVQPENIVEPTTNKMSRKMVTYGLRLSCCD